VAISGFSVERNSVNNNPRNKTTKANEQILRAPD
jgi:hypothetical protein